MQPVNQHISSSWVWDPWLQCRQTNDNDE